MATTNPHDLLPLTPAVFYILLALADGDKHGYGIMQEVKVITDGQFSMGPGTLYGSIKRMLETGLIVEVDDRPDPALDDERRRYYRLTSLGQRVAQAEAERLAALVGSRATTDLGSRLRGCRFARSTKCRLAATSPPPNGLGSKAHVQEYQDPRELRAASDG